MVTWVRILVAGVAIFALGFLMGRVSPQEETRCARYQDGRICLRSDPYNGEFIAHQEKP